MGRVAGRDVILELLETMGQLRSSVERHEVDIERLNARMNAMACWMDDMANRMDDVTARMAAWWGRRAPVTGMVVMPEDMTVVAGT